MKKFWDILGEILAVVLVFAYALWILNGNFHFIKDVTALKVIDILRNYGSLALIAIVGLEAISKRNIIFKIIFLALMALIVIFMFFPGTYNNLMGQISGK